MANERPEPLRPRELCSFAAMYNPPVSCAPATHLPGAVKTAPYKPAVNDIP